MKRWSLVVAANNDAVLRDNLLASPELGKAEAVIVKKGFRSAGQAYNAGLKETASEIILFAHQDVYLPDGWIVHFQRAMDWLDENDPAWAIAGAFGLSRSALPAGLVYCCGNRRVLGQSKARPLKVETLDELLLIMRRSSGLVFDERLPGFHLYGTDICLQARARGMTCYAIHAFCVHNTNKVSLLPQSYWKAYGYMRHKWRRWLPIATPCMSITVGNLPAVSYLLRSLPRALVRRRTTVTTRVADPKAFATR